MPATVLRWNRELQQQIRLWRDNVLDLSIVVDDLRAAPDRDPAELLNAERQLHRAAAHLQRLIDWAAGDQTGPLPEFKDESHAD